MRIVGIVAAGGRGARLGAGSAEATAGYRRGVDPAPIGQAARRARAHRRSRRRAAARPRRRIPADLDVAGQAADGRRRRRAAAGFREERVRRRPGPGRRGRHPRRGAPVRERGPGVAHHRCRRRVGRRARRARGERHRETGGRGRRRRPRRRANRPARAGVPGADASGVQDQRPGGGHRGRNRGRGRDRRGRPCGGGGLPRADRAGRARECEDYDHDRLEGSRGHRRRGAPAGPHARREPDTTCTGWSKAGRSFSGA